VLRRWSRGYGQIEGVYHQNLVGREAFVLQNAPKALAVGQKQLGGGLLGSVDSSVVSFERTTGITGTRVDLSPKLEFQVPLGRSFDGSMSAAYRETAYALTQDQMLGGFNGTATGAEADTLINLPTTSSREAVEVRGRLATGVSRVFDFDHFGLSRVKHTIEPQVEYLYIPSVGQEELPIFDGDDRLASRNVVSYGFASRLLGKRASRANATEGEGDEVFEVARVSLAQSHDFTGGVPQAGESDARTHFSDLDFAMRLHAGPGTSLRLESTYDPTRSDLTSATVGVLLREPDWLWPDLSLLGWMHRSSFGVQYRFIANNSVPDTSTVEQLDSAIMLRVTERVGLRYSARYNIAASQFLSNFFGISYLSACDCWSMDMGIADRSNPNEVQFQVQVGLLGFGSTEGGSRSGVRE
jgi:LPS-assembly protein